VKVSYFFYRTLKIFNDFSRENHGHGGNEYGVGGGFSGVSFHLRRCPQGVASVLCMKTTIFGSRRSKLDHLTVYTISSRQCSMPPQVSRHQITRATLEPKNVFKDFDFGFLTLCLVLLIDDNIHCGTDF
jgi:hypothetical protein